MPGTLTVQAATNKQNSGYVGPTNQTVGPVCVLVARVPTPNQMVNAQSQSQSARNKALVNRSGHTLLLLPGAGGPCAMQPAYVPYMEWDMAHGTWL